MERIVDYKLVLAGTAVELTATVLRELAAGWQPVGGPVALPGGQLAQAVVRAETEGAAAAAERLLAEGSAGSMDTAETHIIVGGQDLTGRRR